MYIPFAELECVSDLHVFYGYMQDSITNASQDCADVLMRVLTGINAYSCVEGIKMHIQRALDMSKLLHIGSGSLRQAAVPKPKESHSLKWKTLPHDAIPSTSRAETQTHQAKKKRTSTKQKHSDDGVIDDDVRKEADYQPAGDYAVEEERGGEEEEGAEQVVEVVDEYDDASTGADGRELSKEISDVHGTKESA